MPRSSLRSHRGRRAPRPRFVRGDARREDVACNARFKQSLVLPRPILRGRERNTRSTSCGPRAGRGFQGMCHRHAVASASTSVSEERLVIQVQRCREAAGPVTLVRSRKPAARRGAAHVVAQRGCIQPAPQGWVKRVR